jgi:hypothetical protein
MTASGVPDNFWGFPAQHAQLYKMLDGLNQANTMPVSESACKAYFHVEVTSIEGFFSFGHYASCS